MRSSIVAMLALALVWWIWAASRTEPRADEPRVVPLSEPAGTGGAARVLLDVEEPGVPAAEVLATSEPIPERREAATNPTPDLLVRLVDMTGRDVDNHPLRVLSIPGPGDVDDGRELYERTDGHGLATFARSELRELSSRADFLLRIELGTRHPDPPSAELPLSEVTAEPIELRVALGRLVIGAREPDGGRWTGRHGAFVRPQGFHSHSSAGATPVVLWVPLGVPYGVKVYGCGLYREVQQDFPPLTISDPEREHVLQLGLRYSGLRGVAVDEAGAPLPPRTALRFRDHGGDGGRGIGLTYVRDEGEFVYPLGLEESEGERRTFAITRKRDGKLHGYAADVRFDVPADGECADVGTVVLAARPVLAAGRVVPPEGYRANGIPVAAEVQDSAGRWRRHPELDNCAFTDEDGGFAVFASDVGGPYRVRVSTSFRDDLDGAIPVRAPGIEYGATDLVIPLVWSGSLEVRVDEEDVRLPRVLEVALHHIPAGADEEVELVRSAGKGDTLSFAGLLPGRARLELRTRDGQVLAEREGLRIEPRRLTEVGTLAPDPTLSWIRLHLLAEARMARVLVGTTGSGSFDREWSWLLNDPYLAVPSLPVDLLVRSPGYRQELLRNVDGDVELRLRKGPRIELRLTGVSGLAGSTEGATVYLVVRLEPVDVQPDPPVPAAPELEVRWSSIEPAGADSETLYLELDEPGRYAVSFQLRVSDDGARRESAEVPAGDLVIGLAGGEFEMEVPDLEVPR